MAAFFSPPPKACPPTGPSHFISVPFRTFPSARTVSPLPTGDWRFLAGDPAGAAALGFADGDWTSIMVPHTWNAADATRGGDLDGKNRTGYHRGPAWYRHAFVVEGSAAGRRCFLRFEGASQTAAVYVNGDPVGHHAGAFTAFCFEITAHVNPGENLLAVHVDNTWDENIPPLEGDFVVFGGLYRPVHLLTTGPLCISPLSLAGPGVHVTAHDVTADAATLEVHTSLSDGRAAPASCTMRVQLIDAPGRLAAETTQDVAPGVKEIRQTLAITRPHLWDGVRDPHLHRVRVDLLDRGGVIDAVEVPFGFRSIAFDTDGGFLLNGRPYRLAGINRHQDRETRGWALTATDHEEDLALIREIGANAVRLAHYPQADCFYELCDRAGLLVWAEIPLVNLIAHTTAFAENCHRQLAELIHQQFNRAGIFAWGIWNELGMSEGSDPEPLIRSLHEFARVTDPSRPTVAASFDLTHRRHPAIVGLTDQIAWNEYPGWYGAHPPAHLGEVIDRLHHRVPDKGLAISEYGAGASIHHHTQDFTQAPPPNGRWHPEEWQAFVHEETWREIARRPFVWGSFVWNLCDFASAMRAEGDRDGINDKGLVTFDRHTRKDAFYFYKATWSSAPVLYLTSRRHTFRTDPFTPVKVYCNCGPVTLSINGEVQPDPEVDGVIHRWPRVMLRRHSNVVEVEAVRYGRLLNDRCTWFLEPPKP
ncbi:MAG: beta galactosidase jelly roll domain-containing protein [Opitutae bacterium]|nr:beta galactosidase jelly roll domain-containing protein [Opitutae bacterium]